MNDILDLIDSTISDTLSDDAMHYAPGYSDDDSADCEDCGHIHTNGDCPAPRSNCGDYRCCIS